MFRATALSVAALSMTMLAGCIDSDYDLGDIDKTIGVGGENLRLPGDNNTQDLCLNDVLDLSKMQKGCLTLHKTVVSLMEVCYKARESVKHEMSPNVKLQHEYPVALKDTYIYTDGKRLEQLLRIFLENACQHTGEGCVTLKVKTFESSETGRDMLQLRVDDTGEGVPELHREQVFKPFWKIDQKSEGLGVGLALCREIAHLLNGKVYLDHDYNGGASFVFEMPLEQL